MKHLLRWGSCAVAALAFGPAGCGETSDVGNGVPKGATYTGPPAGPPGSPVVSVGMGNTGIKPRKAGEAPVIEK